MANHEIDIAGKCRPGDLIQIHPKKHPEESFTARVKRVEPLSQFGNAVVYIAVSPWMRRQYPHFTPKAIGGGTSVDVVHRNTHPISRLKK